MVAALPMMLDGFADFADCLHFRACSLNAAAPQKCGNCCGWGMFDDENIIGRPFCSFSRNEVSGIKRRFHNYAPHRKILAECIRVEFIDAGQIPFI